MRRSVNVLHPALLLSFALTLPATAAIAPTAERIGRYDFSYQIQAQARVTPVQVFDDGLNTYFQFNGGGAVPAIFRMTENGPELTIQTFEGPYLRVDGVAGQYLLRLGAASGRVTYTAGGRKTGHVEPVASTAEPEWKAVVASTEPVAFTPSEAHPRSLETNSYATPTKGDVVAWTAGLAETEEQEFVFAKDSSTLSASQLNRLRKLAKSLKGDYRVVIIGRDDDGLKEGTGEARAKNIAQVLSKSGVQQDRIEGRLGAPVKASGGWSTQVRVVRTPEVQAPIRIQPQPQRLAPLEVPPGGFTLLASDHNIAGSLNRWARSINYQVVWDAPEIGEPQISADFRLNATSMKDAIEQLISGMRAKGYDVAATIYRNRVVRMAHGK